MSSIKRAETLDLFKYGIWIGAAFMFLPIFALPMSELYIYLISIISGTDTQTAREMISATYTSESTYNLFLTALYFTVPFALVAKIMKLSFKEIVLIDKPSCSSRMTGMYILVGMACCYVGNVAATSVMYIFEGIFDLVPVMGEFPEAKGIGEIIFSFITMAVTPALLEEFAFRGVVLGSLRKFGNGVAIFVSALLFAIMHGNFVQIPFAFCVGLGLGFITVATKSMWTAIAVHALNNFLATLTTVVHPIIVNLIYIALLVGGIISIVKIARKGEISRVLKSNVPSCFSSWGRILRILYSPTIIIGVVYFIFTAVLSFEAA